MSDQPGRGSGVPRESSRRSLDFARDRLASEWTCPHAGFARRAARASSMLLTLACLLLLCACASPERDWEKATTANSVAAYQQFLDRHPESAQAADARARIAGLERTAAIESAFRAGTIEALERVLEKNPSDSAVSRIRERLAELHFDRTAAIDSLPAWEVFLARFSTGPPAERAHDRIRVLLDERHPDFRSVKSIRIEVKESYGEAKNVKLPFTEEISALLPHAAVRLTDEDADCVVSVRASGEPYSGNYSQFGFGFGRTLYTGVYLGGTVTLESGKTRLTERFEHEINVPYSTTMSGFGSGPTSPNDAPFRRAFDATVPLAVRKLIARAFGPSPLLLEISSPGGPKNASASARALGRLDPPPYGRLARLLQSKDPAPRRAAAEAIGETKDVRAVAPLLEAVQSDPGLVTPVAAALQRIGSRTVPPLLESIDHADRSVRFCVIEALGLIGDARALDPFVARTADADAEIRCRVAKAMGHFASGTAAVALVGLLEDPASKVRACAAEALAAGADGAVNDDEWNESSRRKYASDALRNSRDPRIVAGLLEALDPWPDGAPIPRHQIMGALSAVGGAAVPALIEALQGTNAARRSAAAEVLGRLHDDRRAVPALITALRSALTTKDEQLASTAAQALGNLHDERAVQVLIEALGSPSSTVRSSAAPALGSIGDPRAIEPLRKLKASGQSDSAVDEALAMLGEGPE